MLSLKIKNLSVYVFLLFVIIISVLNKVYSINSLSFWVDEFVAGVKLFKSNSWSDFFSYFRAYQSDQFPLFHSICYLALRYFPLLFNDIEKLRYISLFFSILNLILFYILGNLLFNKRISIVATLFFAISPFHGLFAQLIRPYVLLEFASICSLLSITLFIQKPNNFNGILWAVTSLLLLLTHFMSILLIAVEIFFIIFLFLKKTNKYYITYSTLNLSFLSIFFIIFFLFTSHAYTREDNLFMGIHSFLKWVVDLFADDAILANEPFFFQGQKCSIISDYWMKEIVNIHPWFDSILILFFLVSLTAVIYYVLLETGIINEFKSQQLCLKKIYLNLTSAKDLEINVFLFLSAIVIIPISILTFVSLFRPCLQPRYTLYSSLILYLFGAWFLFNIKNKKLRYIIFTWIFVSYCYQNMIAITTQKTTDYKSVAKIINGYKKTNEPILSWGVFFYGPPLSNEMLSYHAKLPVDKITPVYSLRDLLNQLKFTFIERNNNSAWLLVDPFVFSFPKETIVEHFLNKSKVDFEKFFFPGMNGIWLYHIKKTPNAFNDSVFMPKLREYGDFVKKINSISPPPEVQNKMIETLPNYIDFSHSPTGLIWLYIAWAYLDRNEPILAEWSAKISISVLPNLPWGYHVLSVSLAEQGKIEEAKEIMDECITKDCSQLHKKNYYPLFHALYLEKNINLATVIIRQVQARGIIIPPIYMRRSSIRNEDVSDISK